jgi:hypothetical protein
MSNLNKSAVCHHCGAHLQFESGYISRTEECPQCGADVHSCLNCVNYDTAAHNRCREPQAEWVTDREKANFCDFFTPNKSGKGDPRASGVVQEAKSAFENLFKK